MRVRRIRVSWCSRTMTENLDSIKKVTNCKIFITKLSLTTCTNFKSKSPSLWSVGTSLDNTLVHSNVTKTTAKTVMAITRQTITSFTLEVLVESKKENDRDSFIYTRNLIFQITLKAKQQNQLCDLLISFDLSGKN